MPPLNTEDFWEDLITAIEAKQVIPIIGAGVVTAPDATAATLNDWLAARLAEKLALPDTDTPWTLNRVATRYLLGGGRRQTLYTRLKQVLDEVLPQLAPPKPLMDLAAVLHCNLFVSTTFDPLLADALNRVRHGGQPHTTVAAYHPAAHGTAKDTPKRKSELPGDSAMVAQLMGRASSKPDYAVWDEDMLEFILALNRDLAEQQMPNLAYDLQDNHLLFLGLGFSDWLTRFFVRVAEQRRLSDTSETSRYLALDDIPLEESLVIFFHSVRQETQVFPCNPAEFCAALRRRWEARNGKKIVAPASDAFRWPPQKMPAGSVFISYSREDIETVKMLKSALEAAGCDVWFDFERIQAGEHWRNSLEDEVAKRCSVFISVISANTERQSGCCHEERAWAEVRQAKEGGVEFYVPVIIDALPPESLRRETRLCRTVNIVPFPEAVPPAAFIARVRELQQQNRRG